MQPFPSYEIVKKYIRHNRKKEQKKKQKGRKERKHQD